MAVVARIVEQLGGQLRVDSALGKGSRFSFLLPLTTERSSSGRLTLSTSNSSHSSLSRSGVPSRAESKNSRTSEIDNLVEALASSHMNAQPRSSSGPSPPRLRSRDSPIRKPDNGRVELPGCANPLKPVKIDEFNLDPPVKSSPPALLSPRTRASPNKRPGGSRSHGDSYRLPKLRILIVEVRTMHPIQGVAR